MRDPQQYARFGDERARPFFDLLSRVPPIPVKDAVDLGCGTGELTRALVERWPEANVLGLDNSPRMLEGAEAFAIPGHLTFRDGDISDYDLPVDLLFSNAALQWVPGHAELFPRLASLVRPGGVMAVQMPNSFSQPSHLLMEETARNGPWAPTLASWHQMSVQPLRSYVDLLQEQGMTVDAWETIYYQQLQGPDPVLEWVRGTSLQPVLTLLSDPEERQGFSDAYAARLREAYPSTAAGTLFPFHRYFMVARRD